LTFVDQRGSLRALSDALTATPTPTRISAITRLIEHVVRRLRERLQGAPVSPPVGVDYNLDAEAEHLIGWFGSWEGVDDGLTQVDADTLCGEGEEGNPGEAFD
jgi:hypothetical protein